MPPDLPRMRRDRHATLQALLKDSGNQALLLLTSGNVMYAGGCWLPAADTSRGYLARSAALVVDGEPFPHLFLPDPEQAPAEFPDDYLHPPLWLEDADGVADAGQRLRDLLVDSRPMAYDDATFAMYAHLPEQLAPVPLAPTAGGLLSKARLIKTPDELDCMRTSWLITEAASYAAEQALRPGVRLTELTGVFFRRLFELGATCNFLDPVFQIMPRRIADGPWSSNGDVPFALVTGDHIVRDGDVIWTDTVCGFEGYASDVGRTWFVGGPSPIQRSLAERWQEITEAVAAAVRPGVTGDMLTKVAIEANGGTKPWLKHYFLGHGLGLEGGEPQRIGSDLGQAFDESFTLAPGMAIILEPVTWQDGHAGYRCEELLFVTEDGCERVGHYPHEL